MNLDRITLDPAKMGGQPCIRGLRITVKRVIEALAVYPNREELRREYPEILESARELGCIVATLDSDFHATESIQSRRSFQIRNPRSRGRIISP